MSIGSMESRREILNLFYFNLFRWERFLQDVVTRPFHKGLSLFGPTDRMMRSTTESDWSAEIMDLLNDPVRGTSIIFTGNHVTLLSVVFVLSVVTFVLALLRITGDHAWYLGLAFAVVSGFGLSYWIAPTDPSNYIGDFKRFEALPASQKRKHALITLLVVASVWISLIVSLVCYSLVARKVAM